MIAGAVKVGPAWAKIEETARRRQDRLAWEAAAERQRKAQEEAIDRERQAKALAQYRVINILPPSFTSDGIIRDVAQKHGITPLEVKGGCRASVLVRARQEAAYRLRTETTLSMPQIGGKLGGRDHSTIHYAIHAHCFRTGAPLPGGMHLCDSMKDKVSRRGKAEGRGAA